MNVNSFHLVIPAIPFLCISQHSSAFLCISLHFSAFLSISQHFNTLFYISLHFSAFHCILLHISAFLSISQYFSEFLCILHFTLSDNLTERTVVLWTPFFSVFCLEMAGFKKSRISFKFCFNVKFCVNNSRPILLCVCSKKLPNLTSHSRNGSLTEAALKKNNKD